VKDELELMLNKNGVKYYQSLISKLQSNFHFAGTATTTMTDSLALLNGESSFLQLFLEEVPGFVSCRCRHHIAGYR